MMQWSDSESKVN